MSEDKWPDEVYGIADMDGGMFSILERFYWSEGEAQERADWLNKYSKVSVARVKKVYLIPKDEGDEA